MSVLPALLAVSLTVTGTGGPAPAETLERFSLRSDTRYGFTVRARGEARKGRFSCGLRSGVNRGVGPETPGLKDGTVLKYVIRTHSGPTPLDERALCRSWYSTGEVEFSEPRCDELVCEYVRADGIELGDGERLCGNEYSFVTAFRGLANNDCRPLVAIRSAEFKSERWCVLAGTEIVFDHRVPGRRLTGGTVTVDCGGYRSGRIRLEASSDGGTWTPIGEVAAKGLFDFAVPSGCGLIRWCGPSDEKEDIQVYGYRVRLGFDGTPVVACGRTRYRTKSDGTLFGETEPHEFFAEDYGDLLPADGSAAVWAVPSSRKVPRWRRPPSGPAKPALRLAMAANEAESVQLVVTPRTPQQDIRAVAGPLVGPSATIPASAVSVKRVGYVPVRRISDDFGCVADWPDPLFPQDAAPCPVPALANQPLWIRVKPPKGTPPGVYRGELSLALISSGRTATVAVPVEVRVFGFEMPDDYSLQLNFGLSPAVNAYHSAKTDAQKDRTHQRYLRALGEHHVSATEPIRWDSRTDYWTCTFPGFKRGDDATRAEPVFDWTAYDRAIGAAMTNCHLKSFGLRIPGLGHCAWNNTRPKVFQGFTPQDPEYEILMGKMLSGLEAHLREKGWLERTFVHCYDEPLPEAYGFLMEGFAILKRHAPGIRRMLTARPDPELIGGPNLWVPQTIDIDDPRFEQRRAAGDEIWFYICNNPKAPYAAEFIDRPGTDLRVWLWQAWMRKVTGVLIW